MANFILAAPDAENRFLEDYRHSYQENSYTEVINVINGICRCNDLTTKDTLIRKGYKVIDPGWVCQACPFIAINAKEFEAHKKTHEEKTVKKLHGVFELLGKSHAILEIIRKAK